MADDDDRGFGPVTAPEGTPLGIAERLLRDSGMTCHLDDYGHYTPTGRTFLHALAGAIADGPCSRGDVPDEKAIRQFLWLNHGHRTPYLYGDDGEMQCHSCITDYRRGPLIDLVKMALTARSAVTKHEIESALGLTRRDDRNDPCGRNPCQGNPCRPSYYQPAMCRWCGRLL